MGPDGDAVPRQLVDAAQRRTKAPLGVYIHVPYCASRCGYCDFNTYTAAELGPGVSRESWLGDVSAEIRLAGELLGQVGVRSVFFGGGTPTLLPPGTLVAALREVDRHLGLLPDAEVTTEANPESVSPGTFAVLREGGFTRISLGMQSADPGVLRVLDRQHTPLRAVAAAHEARQAGFDHVSLDLIYGTPGETAAQWRESLDTAVGAGVDHVSAYALTVEQGTALAAKVNRGRLPGPDPDVAAQRYEIADTVLSEAGLQWYEISNFAAPGGQCEHNLGYWRNQDWLGFGPGAHSHIAGLRWWNVKHPRTYAERTASGELPVEDWEELTAEQRRLESLMLQIRLREGLENKSVDLPVICSLIDDGLMAVEGDRLVLTLRGRLLADRVTLRLYE